MSKEPKFLQRIPQWLSSEVSIFIYLFLFFYLVVFAVLTMVIPALSAWKPSADIQLILGNYTNVLSALGASLAAGSGLKVHKSLKSLHDKHDAAYAELQATIEKLHEKIDRLEERSEQADGKTQ